MSDAAPVKPVEWIGSSLADLRVFPESVRLETGHALWVAQNGGKSPSAKPLKGFGGGSVLEIVSKDASGTYRVVYAVQLGDVVYVLHCFQKKSKSGIATPPQEIEMVKRRLKVAEEHYAKRSK